VSSSRTIRLTEYPRASRVLVHLSDVHLRELGQKLYEHIDSTQQLTDALRLLENMGVHPDALVFTGDLADFGEDGAYRKLRELVDAAAARMDTQTVWVMGNHDDRTLFKKRMLDEHPDPASTADQPADAVYDIAGLRVISLDSTVPGNHYGLVTEPQLEWLAEILATTAERGTVLAMHHPPIPMTAAAGSTR
jgi:Icc protein